MPGMCWFIMILTYWNLKKVVCEVIHGENSNIMRYIADERRLKLEEQKKYFLICCFDNSFNIFSFTKENFNKCILDPNYSVPNAENWDKKGEHFTFMKKIKVKKKKLILHIVKLAVIIQATFFRNIYQKFLHCLLGQVILLSK
jgi:hypothetical protein